MKTNKTNQQFYEDNRIDLSHAGDEHTEEHPYCRHLACWCHTNSQYSLQVTGFPAEEPAPEQVERAHRFFGLPNSR